jgi:isohexenylglutaconyl-CoA hydratase
MSGYSSILLECDGAVARLTLNRPERRNALTHAMMLELEDAFGRLREDASCRVLVLRGAGGHFCAGGDIDAMANMPPRPADGGSDPMVASYRQFGRALQLLDALPQATVAIVEGSAVGGGFGMACCSDVVIIHESARFGLPEPRWGFIPSQLIPFVVRRVGEGTVRDLVVTGRVIDAAEAHRLNIGRHLVSGSDLDRVAAGIVGDILKSEPQAVADVKRLVQSCENTDDAAVLDNAAQSLVDLLRRPETEAGMKAFKQKVPPPWAKLS